MEIIIALVFISIVLAVFFLVMFIWASKGGQFEDLQGPAMRILFEEKIPKKDKIKSNGTRKI